MESRFALPALAVMLAMAASWCLLIDQLQREEQRLDDAAHRKVAVMTHLVEENAVGVFRRVDDLLLDLVAQHNGNPNRPLRALRALDEGLVAGIRLYDAAGTLTMASDPFAFPTPITGREEFLAHRDAVQPGLVIGLPYNAPRNGRTLLPISRRLEGVVEDFSGIVVADVPADTLVRFYDVLDLPADAVAMLLRADGTVLARSAAIDRPAADSLASTPLWQSLTDRKAGPTRTVGPVDEVERILAHHLASDYALVAIVGLSVDSVFAAWRESAQFHIGWAIAATMLILLLTMRFAVERRWRRRADRALGIRNRAMAGSGDGILIADATRPDMPIVYGNPALERLMGLAFPGLLGRGALWALERVVTDRAVLEPLREAIVLGRDVRVEFKRAAAPTGQESCLELRASPVRNVSGRLVSLIAIVRDISEHKRVQAELAEARREADRANVAKSKFLASASHDLRQPVQSLLLLMEVLSARATDAASRNVLGTMDRALGALKMLLDGLLDVSRLEAGAVVPEPQDFPVAELLERIAANSRPVAIQRRLLFHIIPCTAHVRSDPMLLGRILQNLVDNALRYTDTGRILIGCRRNGGLLRIEVWDTGIGIPLDQQEDIFEEFVQVGNASRNRDQGLGLGLAVVRRLSAMLDHRVTLRSAPGRGSVFTVEIPLAKPPDAAVAEVPSPAPSKPAVAAATVLVIEDDEIVREGLQAMLKEWGCKVMAAASCAEALDLAQRGPMPDVIVADYRLGGGHTGTEAIREVRLALDRILPGILVTGDTAPARAQEAEAGNFRVMHKPVEAGALRGAIAEAMAPAREEQQRTA